MLGGQGLPAMQVFHNLGHIMYCCMYATYHCKSVKVISTLSWLPQLHLLRGFYSSPPNEYFFVVIKTLPLIKIS